MNRRGLLVGLGMTTVGALIPAILPAQEATIDLSEWHNPFGGQRWRLTPAGVEVEGKGLLKPSADDEDAVARVLSWFGPQAKAAASEFHVPVELIVAIAAIESVRGARTAAQAARAMSGSGAIGVMQTLRGTASGALRRSVTVGDLQNPALSLRAGAAYIASQQRITKFSPPLVFAAYNVGSLRRDKSAINAWQFASHGHGMYSTLASRYLAAALNAGR